VTSTSITVGASVTDFYTLVPPTSSRTWCSIVNNEIVNIDGTAWSGSSQISAT